MKQQRSNFFLLSKIKVKDFPPVSCHRVINILIFKIQTFPEHLLSAKSVEYRVSNRDKIFVINIIPIKTCCTAETYRHNERKAGLESQALWAPGWPWAVKGMAWTGLLQIFVLWLNIIPSDYFGYAIAPAIKKVLDTKKRKDSSTAPWAM